MSTESKTNYDAYAPSEIAERIEKLGVSKSQLPFVKLLMLAILAGAFISVGSMLFLVVTTDSNLGFGITRLIGGITFSLGLILVVIAGAELFTGNNLMAMAWVDRKISTRVLLKNWTIVYFGNVLGCLLTVIIIAAADLDLLHQGSVGKNALQVAEAKLNLSFFQVFARGVLCNALVCIAIWLVMAGRSVIDKVVAVLFPVSAFVTMGLEHSIANWFFLPYAGVLDPGHFNTDLFLLNILASTLGNIIGGTVLVAGIYYLAYRRSE